MSNKKQQEMNKGNFLTERQLWHIKKWELHSTQVEDYLPVFNMMFQSCEYKKLTERRIRIYNEIAHLQNKGGIQPQKKATLYKSLFERLLKADADLALYILEQMARYQQTTKQRNAFPFDEVTRVYGQKPETADIAKTIGELKQRIIFKCDSLESDIVDLFSACSKLEGSEFDHGEGMRFGLDLIRSTIKNENDNRTNEENDLYAETADSISSYMNKRIATFYNRIADMRNKAIRAAQRAKEKEKKEALALAEIKRKEKDQKRNV